LRAHRNTCGCWSTPGWYQRFWNEKLDTLEALLRAEDEAKAKKQKE